MLRYWVNNKVHKKNQLRLFHERSSITHLFEFISLSTVVFDENYIIKVVYLDFRQAFASKSHSNPSFLCTTKISRIFWSLRLNNRTEIVFANGVHFQRRNPPSGLLQKLVFLCFYKFYSWNILTVYSIMILLFANNSKLIKSSARDCNTGQWMNRNPTLNVYPGDITKCNHISIKILLYHPNMGLLQLNSLLRMRYSVK